MSLELDDWSAHMLQAEVQLKAMNHDLLHKNYADISIRATAAKKYIDRTVAWVAKQGSSKGVDVVQILQDNLPAQLPVNHSLMVAAIQEIEQLRAERQFWLKSGFDIGKSDAKQK